MDVRRETTGTLESATTIPVSAPIQPDQEWANALTHGLSTLLWIGVGGVLISLADNVGDRIAASVYVASVIGVFSCSTASHTFLNPPWLERFRSWDQAMIYTMIVGTYTPIAWKYAPPSIRNVLLAAMWIAAAIGFIAKIGLKHRINGISVVGYLMLGWLPAVPLIREVPWQLAATMLGGGVIYTIGVVLLLNDSRARFVHAGWHMMVLAASLVHAWGIAEWVLSSTI